MVCTARLRCAVAVATRVVSPFVQLWKGAARWRRPIRTRRGHRQHCARAKRLCIVVLRLTLPLPSAFVCDTLWQAATRRRASNGRNAFLWLRQGLSAQGRALPAHGRAAELARDERPRRKKC